MLAVFIAASANTFGWKPLLLHRKGVLGLKKRQIIRNVIVLTYTLSVTFMVGEWAMKYALTERGYKAAGGEYLLISIVAWVAYKVINILLDLLEDIEEIDYTDN